MPTLRRSKSLNDKITRQKNRSGDVIRDPRSPDVEGRTRTCVDNFQALVHLRKQTEDKARQLELAYNYATHGSSYLRRTPAGGVELPYTADTIGSAVGTSLTSPRQPGPLDSRIPGPAPRRRQRSPDGGRQPAHGVRRHGSFSESQPPPPPPPPLQQHLSRRGQQPPPSQQQQQQQQPKCQRPMSMFEPRVGGLFPTPDELQRKDQVIQNLTDSQRSLNAHNQQLLSKIDELEFHNHRLKALLTAHNIADETSPRQPARRHRPARAAGPHGDVIRVPDSVPPSAPPSTVVSPNSETSVSGYGSLAGSACGDGYPSADPVTGGREGAVEESRTERGGDYDDDTLPLSAVSADSEDSRKSTLARSASSGDSRGHTLNKDSDRSDMESIHDKLDQVLELERHRDGDRKRRIEELEKQVEDLTSQRTAVLTQYKQVVEEHDRLLRREEHVHRELSEMLARHQHSLGPVIRSELQHLHEQLQAPGQHVLGQLQVALTALAAPPPAFTEQVTTDPDVRKLAEQVVDLIGPEYVRLGRGLELPQPELERIENGQHSPGEKTRQVLNSWLERRGGPEPPGTPSGTPPGTPSGTPSARHLELALRAMDKDIRLFTHTPITGPERLALRNCLQHAIDHVTEAQDLLDHVIALNALSPADVTFVQEVSGQRERVLARLWHVAEYRATGIVSTIVLALDRAHYPQVSARLTSELEMQNSRLHSQSHPLGQEQQPTAASTAPTASTAAVPVASRLPAGPPKSRLKPRSKTPEAVAVPIMEVPERSVPAAQKERSIPTVQKEKPSPATQKERSLPVPVAQKERSIPAPQKKRSIPVPQRDRSVPASQRERSSPASQRERSNPSPSRRDGSVPATQRDRSSPASQKDGSVPASQRDRSNPSPSRKDGSVPASQRDRSNPSPSQRDGSVAASQKEKSLGASQRERSNPASQKESVPASQREGSNPASQKESVPASQREGSSPASQKDGSVPAPPRERSIPTPQRERQSVWDRRVAAGAARGAAARNTVILEQGSKISRV